MSTLCESNRLAGKGAGLHGPVVKACVVHISVRGYPTVHKVPWLQLWGEVVIGESSRSATSPVMPALPEHIESAPLRWAA